MADWWKYAGGLAGGTIGFVASGFNPVGAVAGASIGAGLAGSADAASKASDVAGTPLPQQQVGQPNQGAFAAPGYSSGGLNPGGSATQLWQAQMGAQQDAMGQTQQQIAQQQQGIKDAQGRMAARQQQIQQLTEQQRSTQGAYVMNPKTGQPQLVNNSAEAQQIQAQIDALKQQNDADQKVVYDGYRQVQATQGALAQQQDQLAKLQGQGSAVQHSDDMGYVAGQMRDAQGRTAPQMGYSQVMQGPGGKDLSRDNYFNAPPEIQQLYARAHADPNDPYMGGGAPLTAEERAKLDDYTQRVNSPIFADYQDQLNARGEQAHQVDLLRAAAEGRGPSAAQDTLFQGRDAAIRSNLALANSARGGAGAQVLAQRQAQDSEGGMMQDYSRQAAILRAQEMQAAQAQYGQAAAALRGADQASRAQNIGIGTTNAGLQQQAAGTNLNAQMQTTQQNDARQQSLLDMYFGQQNADRNASMGYEQMKQTGELGVAGINANTNAQNKAAQLAALQAQQNMYTQIAGAGATLGASALTSGGSAAKPAPQQAATPRTAAYGMETKNPYG